MSARWLGLVILCATVAGGCGSKKAAEPPPAPAEKSPPSAAGAPGELTTWGETALAHVGHGAVTAERLQRYLRLREIEAQRTGREAPTPLEVMAELVDDELLVQLALREGVLADDDTARQRLIAGLYQKRKLDGAEDRPTDEVLKAYYEANRDKFPASERLRMRHLLLRVDPSADEAVVAKVKAKAEGLRREATRLAPDEFGTLARKHSEDPSAVHGGELGFLPMDRWLLVFGPDFAALSASVKPAEVGPVVRSRQGFHVFQVVDRKAADADPLEVQRREILAAYLEGQRSGKKKALLEEARRLITLEVVGDPNLLPPAKSPASAPTADGGPEASSDASEVAP